MSIDTKKLNLIDRLMRIRTAEILDQVEDILVQAELEDRTSASLAAIDKGQVVPLERFIEDTGKWLKEQATG